MRLAIHWQREIARLHFYDPAQSHRAIARVTGLSATTVASLRERLLANTELMWESLQALDDEVWCKTLGTEDRSIAKRKAAPDWEIIHREMQRPDATLDVLWQDWRKTCPEGIGYTQFTDGYRRWVRGLHIVMRRVHRPGDKLFVDFAGRTVEVRDRDGGPSTYAQIFVAVLGHSNYTYLEATATQTTSDWIRCHINCFEAICGAPQWVVSDNLKAAVWRREREEIVINPAYRDALRHYDTAPLPAGSRKPKHKAKAEVGVQIAQRWILFRLRDRVYFSLEELNRDLRELTAQMNDHPFRKLPGSRRERYEAADRGALKPLPQVRYELCDWRYGVRVGDDYHFEHDRRFYSVAVHFARERIDVRTTAKIVEAFHRGRRIAVHQLLTTPGEVSTLPEHRPIVHQRVLDGEPKELVAWSRTVGPNAEKMVRHHIESRTDATNGVRAARRMRDLARLHGDARFEEVCAYALPLNITALRSISSIIVSGADKRTATRPTKTQTASVHSNLRGARYFGDPE